MLPFTMKDHLEMYTTAQVRAGNTNTNEKFMNHDKSSYMKQTNRTVKLPHLRTSGDLSNTNNISHQNDLYQ